MSVESLFDKTIALDDTDVPDHLHMCYLHISRLLDEVHSLEDVKYIFLVEMMNLSRENNLLKHDVMTLHNDVSTLVKAVKALQG